MIVDRDYALMMLRLAERYREVDEIEFAINYMEQAKEIFYQLNEDDYRICLARLGILHYSIGNKKRARTFFEQYHHGEGILYYSHPEDVSFKTGFANSYLYLGDIELSLDNQNLAIQFYENGVKLLKEVYESQPLQNLEYKELIPISMSYLTFDQHDYIKSSSIVFPVFCKNNFAVSLTKLGNSYSTIEDFDNAKTVFLESLRLLEELYISNPLVVDIKLNLTALYFLLGKTELSIGNLTKGLTFFKKNLQLNKEFYETYPEILGSKRNWATDYFSFGDRQILEGNLEGALFFFNNSLVLWNELYDTNSQNKVFKNIIAICHAKLGKIYNLLGNSDQALICFTEEANIVQELVEIDPLNVQFAMGLAISYERLGEMKKSLGELKKALYFFEEERKVFASLIKREPENLEFQRGLASSYSKLGEIYNLLGDFDEALGCFEQSSVIAKKIYHENPNDIELIKGLAISYSKLGEMHNLFGAPEKAWKSFEMVTKLFGQLFKSDPQSVDFKIALAIAYEKLGETQIKLADPAKALTYFKEDVELSRELYEIAPDNVVFKHGLAIACGKLGDAQSLLGNMQDALIFLKEYYRLENELHTAFPLNIEFINELGWSYFNLGIVYEKMFEKAIAKSHYKLAQAHLTEAVRMAPENFAFNANLKTIQEKLLLISFSGPSITQKGELTGIKKTFYNKDLVNEGSEIIEAKEIIQVETLGKMISEIRLRILKANFEKALLLSEEFFRSFRQLTQKDQASRQDYLAEVKMLIGICYGNRVRDTISEPENKYLSESQMLAKSLLEVGNNVTALYLESTWHRIKSLQKMVKGWFPSRKIKSEIRSIKQESIETVKNCSLSEDAMLWLNRIRAIEL